MFNESKYTKWYYIIVNNAKERQIFDTEQYYEKHHIIPKSLNGSNNKNNIVKLTGKEHYVAHLLLLKMCDNTKDKRKMAYSFNRMCQKGKWTTNRYNSNLYEYHRKIRAKNLSGKGNGMFGKKHTAVTKLKMRNKRLGNVKSNTPENLEKKRQKWLISNPNYNKESASKIVDKNSKLWELISPTGEILIIKNLTKYCRENNLNQPNLSSKGKHKGWKCRPYFQNTINN